MYKISFVVVYVNSLKQITVLYCNRCAKEGLHCEVLNATLTQKKKNSENPAMS